MSTARLFAPAQRREKRERERGVAAVDCTLGDESSPAPNLGFRFCLFVFMCMCAFAPVEFCCACGRVVVVCVCVLKVVVVGRLISPWLVFIVCACACERSVV